MMAFRRLLLGLVLASVALAVPPAEAHASVGSCAAFSIHGSAGTLRATHVRLTSRITCRKARVLLAGAYGEGAIRAVYPKNDQGQRFGRPTYWLPGGWRCSNGAGGAACRNANDERYNEVNGSAVSADTR